MARKSRIVLGLNSGTSADGVDAVACEIAGRGLGMKVRVLGHVARPYSDELRRRILAVMAPAETRTDEICLLETLVGEAFADAAERLVKKLSLRRVDLIGSHGQTICHLPPRLAARPRRALRPSGLLNQVRQAAGTLQIGDPTIIASRLHSTVVSHFRQADMAVGGQGAPLVPWTDAVLFRDRRRTRIIQNIGGIANLTWLPAGGDAEGVIAFDTGPGNMVIDALTRHFSRGRRHFDNGGRAAARGTPRLRLLERWLLHPYFREPPPKSCGREQFGEAWIRGELTREGRGLPNHDWLATATMLTARSMVESYARFLPAERGGLPIDEWIVCGGGAKNRTMMSMIRGMLTASGCGQVQLSTTADYGIRPEEKEGVSFAMLAAACVDHVPANLPQVTGAKRRVVLGQVCNPESLK